MIKIITLQPDAFKIECNKKEQIFLENNWGRCLNEFLINSPKYKVIINMYEPKKHNEPPILKSTEKFFDPLQWMKHNIERLESYINEQYNIYNSKKETEEALEEFKDAQSKIIYCRRDKVLKFDGEKLVELEEKNDYKRT